MTTDYAISSDAAIPPGLYLADVLAELGMSQADLARRMGRPPQAINEIVSGRKALTADTAIELEQVLGVPAHIWNNLESGYRLALARIRDEEEDLSADLQILSGFRFYPFLARRGLVKSTRKASEKVMQLREFFAVTEIANVERSYSPAFRLTEVQRERNSTLALASWLRAAEITVETILQDTFIPEYDQKTLVGKMQTLRRHSIHPLPEVMDAIEADLRQAGVQLVLQQSLPGCGMCGAAFWFRGRHPVVVVSDHGKTEDRFWFSLLHELSHIVRHGQKRVFIDLDNISDRAATEQMEKEADELAMSSLISHAEYRAISWNSDYPTDDEIHDIARRLGIHEGIVAGRLCREEELPWNRLRKFTRRFSLE